MGQHIEERQSAYYLEGLLSDKQAAAFKQHLSRCSGCRKAVAKQRALNTLIKNGTAPKLTVSAADKRVLMSAIRKSAGPSCERSASPFFRWSFGIASAFVLLFAFFIFQPTQSVTVLSSSGDVSITGSGTPYPAKTGDRIKRGSVLTTERYATCLLSFGGNILQLPASSSVSLNQLRKHGARYDIVLDLRKGRLISNIKDKKIIGSLVVRDGTTETRVKGTIFMMEKSRTGERIISVLNGHVSVKEKNRSFDVRSDHKLLLGSSGSPVASVMTSADRDLYDDVINIGLYYSARWTTPLTTEAGMKVVSDERVVYTLSKQGHIMAFKKLTGEFLWRVKAGAEITSDPVVENGRLYVNSSDGYCYIIKNGEIRKRLASGPFAYSAPLIREGVLYLGNTRGVITAWDIASEKTLWQKDNGAPILSNLAIEKGVIIAATMSGTLNAFSLGGSLLWTRTLSGRLIESPASFLYGDIVIGTSSGDIYRLNAASGAQVWKKHVASQLNQPVHIVDGLIIVASERTMALDGSGNVTWTREISGTDIFITEKGLMVSDGRIYVLDRLTGETRSIYSKVNHASMYASKNDIFMTREGNLEKVN